MTSHANFDLRLAGSAGTHTVKVMGAPEVEQEHGLEVEAEMAVSTVTLAGARDVYAARADEAQGQ